jgi:small subunit ribosomal protein S5
VVIGNKAGRVGVGVSKGKDVSQAVEKAANQAKKNIADIPIISGTIPHQVSAKYSSAQVLIKPAKKGKGVVAGGAVRSVLLLCGLKDVSAKILGRTPNKLTNAMATLEALKKLKR